MIFEEGELELLHRKFESIIHQSWTYYEDSSGTAYGLTQSEQNKNTEILVDIVGTLLKIEKDEHGNYKNRSR